MGLSPFLREKLMGLSPFLREMHFDLPVGGYG